MQDDTRPCKDCGEVGGLGWWRGRMKHPGPAGPRCHPCFKLYTRRKPSYRAGWESIAGPPPVCVCGVEVISYHNTVKRCPTCAAINARERRGEATARRTLAVRTGDSDIHWRNLGERDGWRCHLCGKKVPSVAGTAKRSDGATVDHLVPIADGGAHTWGNVRLAHRFCNLSRGTRGEVQLLLAV
jgi:5-methylcytosine-specific restriction endonuclease McrA